MISIFKYNALLAALYILSSSPVLSREGPAFINDEQQIYYFSNYNIAENQIEKLPKYSDQIAYYDNDFFLFHENKMTVFNSDTGRIDERLDFSLNPEDKLFATNECFIWFNRHSISFASREKATQRLDLRKRVVDISISNSQIAILSIPSISIKMKSRVEIYEMAQFPPVVVASYDSPFKYTSICFNGKDLFLADEAMDLYELKGINIEYRRRLIEKKDPHVITEDDNPATTQSIYNIQTAENYVACFIMNSGSDEKILKCIDLKTGTTAFESIRDSYYFNFQDYVFKKQYITLLTRCRTTDNISYAITIYAIWNNKHKVISGWKQWFAVAQYCDIASLQAWSIGNKYILYANKYHELHELKISDFNRIRGPND